MVAELGLGGKIKGLSWNGRQMLNLRGEMVACRYARLAQTDREKASTAIAGLNRLDKARTEMPKHLTAMRALSKEYKSHHDNTGEDRLRSKNG